MFLRLFDHTVTWTFDLIPPKFNVHFGFATENICEDLINLVFYQTGIQTADKCFARLFQAVVTLTLELIPLQYNKHLGVML